MATLETFIGYVRTIFNAIFVGAENSPALATQLLTFITSNWICLIGLIMWLFVAVIGAVRRFIPGV